MRAQLALSVALSCLLASGCSVVGRKHGGGAKASIPSGSKVPAPPTDVLSVPDAVPKVEPRGTRGNPPFYEVFGKRYYVMASSAGWVERGTASWYGPGFHAASTSLGEPYDMYAMTAAHKTLPIPAYAEVTNLRNGRKIVVRINDRGPFVGDRIIDLSYTAAAKLDFLTQGTAPVEVRVITPGQGTGPASATTTPTIASAPTPAPISTPPPAPATPPPSPPVTVVNAPATSAPGTQGMFIQAGVFADHENARRRVESLLAAGIELASLDELAGQRTLHRVRVGPFATVEEFDLNLKRLRDLGIADARLLTQ
jgi:rare lipoprotein A